MLRLGVSNLGWTQPSGVAPELSLVFSSSGADHRGQEVLSTGAWKSPRAAWGRRLMRTGYFLPEVEPDRE